jgi:hypothetical protein
MTSNNDIPDRRPPGTPVYDTTSDSAAVPVDTARSVRSDVLEREKAKFGGFKFGSAFSGGSPRWAPPCY